MVNWNVKIHAKPGSSFKASKLHSHVNCDARRMQLVHLDEVTLLMYIILVVSRKQMEFVAHVVTSHFYSSCYS